MKKTLLVILAVISVAIGAPLAFLCFTAQNDIVKMIGTTIGCGLAGLGMGAVQMITDSSLSAAEIKERDEARRRKHLLDRKRSIKWAIVLAISLVAILVAAFML